MKNKLIILIFAVLLIGSVSAYEPHKQNTDLSYSFTSNNATGCNLTTGNTPNGLVTINQQSNKSDNTFNNTITSGNFSTLGNYCFNLVCTDGSGYETGSFCREVTPNGEIMDGWRIAIQIFVSVSALFLMVLFLYLSASGITKHKGSVEDSGGIRFFFLGLSLVFLVAHILITNVIIHNTLGVGAISGAYTNVMYIFFTIIILMFVYTLVKISFWEIDLLKRKWGLK